MTTTSNGGRTTTTTNGHSSSSKKKKEFHYEFGGPIGALVTTCALPAVVLLLAHWSHVGYVDLKVVVSSNTFWKTVCPNCHDPRVLLQAMGLLLCWFGFQVLLERLLPCELVQGAPIHGDTSKRLTYRINGHLAFWVTLLLVQVAWPTWHDDGRIQFTSFPIEYLYQHYVELAYAAIGLCILWSIWLYFDSFARPPPNVPTTDDGKRILAKGGDSGHAVYDFFIGRELNPRCCGSIDWKEFCELRPGLILWMLLNMSCLKQQYLELGYVTYSMMLINIFHGVYVWDALYQERAILTTMDLTTDGFGFMLCFGDLAWVPFTYSLQARYLVRHDPHLHASWFVLILAVHSLGYIIFRGANGQKDAFRRNPQDPALQQQHLTFLQTKRGTKLLTSGWWGMARKINYTGDYIMGVSWCMVCGFDSLVPYYYAVYFLILLIHRSIRDDHLCQEKYGEDWTKYKELVPYRFIPGVV